MAWANTWDERITGFFSSDYLDYSDAPDTPGSIIPGKADSDFWLGEGVSWSADGFLIPDNGKADADVFDLGYLYRGNYSFIADISSWFIYDSWGSHTPTIIIYDKNGTIVSSGTGTHDFYVTEPGSYFVGVSGSPDIKSQYSLSYNWFQEPNISNDSEFTIVGEKVVGGRLTLQGEVSDPNGTSNYLNEPTLWGWYADGVQVSSFHSYTLKEADQGKFISAGFGFYDDAGHIEIAGDGFFFAANNEPEGELQILGDAIQGQTLILSFDITDADGIVGDANIQWYAGDSPIAGATGQSLLLTQQQVGEPILFTITYTDGIGVEESISSAPTGKVENINDPPFVNRAMFDRQYDQYDHISFNVPIGTFSDVDDGDLLTYTAELVNGNALPGWLNFDSLDRRFSGTPVVGNHGPLEVSVTATDESGESVSTSFTLTVNQKFSAQVEILGGDQQVSDSNGETGETITFQATATDPDGSVVSNEWLINGEVVATGLSADIFLPDGNTTLTFRAVDNDGLESFDQVSVTVGGVIEDLVVEGSSDDDNLMGGKGNDRLVGQAGSDTLQGFSGDDELDGGPDLDHAFFQGELLNYSVLNDQGTLEVVGPIEDGTDTLTGIERLHFTDSSLAFDLDGNAGLVVKLLGVILGKDSWYNKHFLGIGIDFLDNSPISYDDLMDIALEAVLGPDPSNEAVVNLVYTNVAGQAPSQAELDLFTGYLDDKVYTQSSLAVAAAEHELNLNNVNFIELVGIGVEYIPFAG